MSEYEGLRADFLEVITAFQKVCDKIKFPGLSRSELVMLHTICGKRDENLQITVSKLAACLEVSLPAVSRMVKGLEDKGLVCRMVNNKDRRSSNIMLTEHGEQSWQTCCDKMNNLGERGMKYVGAQDMTELIRLTRKMLEFFEKEIG